MGPNSPEVMTDNRMETRVVFSARNNMRVKRVGTSDGGHGRRDANSRERKKNVQRVRKNISSRGRVKPGPIRRNLPPGTEEKGDCANLAQFSLRSLRDNYPIT